MKTVVQQILEELKEYGFSYSEEREKLILQSEKQQIIDAYESGEKNIDFPALHGQGKLSDSKIYYTSTYITNK